MSIRNGVLLDDRYQLQGRLAVGGMGEVWQGRDEVLDRTVAVKILRSELADDDAFRRRFRAEARTAGRLPHAGIAAVYDYGETEVDGVPLAYLVMELVPGRPLSAIIAEEGALGTDRTLDVVGQTARALHAAHLRGVVHRDVKPANLMVTPEGRVKVTDFGIARPQDHEPLTATGQVMGTAHYLAPELARGKPATPQSDVYALGVVAYECLAGHRPFEGDNQVAVATAHLREPPPPLPMTLAPEVRQVVAAAMEKDPALRIPDAEAFAAALESLRWRSGLTGWVTEVVGRTPATSAAVLAVAPPPTPSLLPPPPPRRAGPGATAEPGVPARPTESLPERPGSDGSGGATRAGEHRDGRGLPVPRIALFALVALVVFGGLITGTLLGVGRQQTPTGTPAVPATGTGAPGRSSPSGGSPTVTAAVTPPAPTGTTTHGGRPRTTPRTTATPTRSSSPTVSSRPTPSVTPSVTPSRTPTRTPPATPSVTTTPSVTPTASVTPTITISPSP